MGFFKRNSIFFGIYKKNGVCYFEIKKCQKVDFGEVEAQLFLKS